MSHRTNATRRALIVTAAALLGVGATTAAYAASSGPAPVETGHVVDASGDEAPSGCSSSGATGLGGDIGGDIGGEDRL